MTQRPLIERSVVLFLVIFFLLGSLLFRLFEKQVLEHQQYAQAALAQSTNTTVQPAERGRIYAKDRDGKLLPLAVSEWSYQLSISPRQVKNKSKLIAALKEDLPSINTDELMAKIDNDKVFLPPVLKNIDGDTAKKITDKDYAGVFMIPSLSRIYPEGSNIASQILGFVGGDGTGKYGVEAVYDNLLRGTSGQEKAKRDSLGRLIDVLSGQDSQSGSDLVLTIDYNVQFQIENKLKEALQKYQADSGSIVVMDPKTGAILGMSGQPTFDPNTYGEVSGDDQRSFLAPGASDIYEPGSVIKPITMAAAIDTGAVTPDTTNVFGQSVTVQGKEIFNAKKDAFGKENMEQVLENSDNVAMVWVGSLLGTDKEREYLDKFGFGTKSSLDLVGEQSGLLRQRSEWNDLLRSTAAFGQGISATVVQLAAAYSAIANGGTLVAPHVAEKSINGETVTPLNFPARGSQIISADTAAKIRTMLVGVVEQGHGKRAKVEGIKVGGKTGTAQIPDPQGGYYEDRHIGTFAGLFPADDPKIVMVIRLNNPKDVNFAESSAAPTFGEIAAWLTTYYNLR